MAASCCANTCVRTGKLKSKWRLWQSVKLKGLWRHPDFLKLWAGQTISLFGSQISLLAIPLTAVLFLGATPFQMGILTAVGSIPTLLFGLLAGVWVDRSRKRAILIIADAGRFILLSLIPLAFLLGILRIELLYLLTFLVGVLTLFFNVAYRSYLPALIEHQALVEGNSKLEVSQSIGEIVGPGLAGVLMQVVTAPFVILADALSFLVSVASLAWIRMPEATPKMTNGQSKMGREIIEGLRFVFGEPLLRSITSGYATLTLFNSILEAVFILYLTKGIGIQPAQLGVIFALSSVGFVVGALLAEKVTQSIGTGYVLLIAPLVIGASDLLLPLAGLLSPVAFPLVGLAQIFFGLTRPVFTINQVSLQQAVTPEKLQGQLHYRLLVRNLFRPSPIKSKSPKRWMGPACRMIFPLLTEARASALSSK